MAAVLDIHPSANSRPSPYDNLCCPLDELPLTRSDNTMRCANGHSFDFARQGYLHLLPVQHKHSRNPGDSAEMVAARRQLLHSGAYQPLSDRVIQLADNLLAGRPAPTVIDAGCGEGYYLSRLQPTLQSGARLLGVDISKSAIAAAARGNKSCGWLVASNAHLPVVPDSQNLLICLFGFPDYRQFLRCLKPGGFLLMADPGPDHLIELRRMIYPTIHPQRSQVAEKAVAGGFAMVDEQMLRFEFTLSQQDLAEALLQMTPHGHRAQQSIAEVAAQLVGVQQSAEIALRIFAKSN